MSVFRGNPDDDVPNKWLVIGPKGKILFIDWDHIDDMADAYINHGVTNSDTAMGMLAYAIREYVLESVVKEKAK